MIAYLDASVILRLVMKEADPLQEWPDIVQGVASTLAEVEVFRTLDRMRFYDPLVPDRALAARREAAVLSHGRQGRDARDEPRGAGGARGGGRDVISASAVDLAPSAPGASDR